MTGPEFFYSLVLAVLGGTISILVCNDRKNTLALVGFFQLSFWMRWAFAYLNFVLKFWEQKDLSDMSLSMIDQPGGVWAVLESHIAGYASGTFISMQGIKFFIEAMANLPALRLFEESISMLILTDCFLGAICGVVVFAYLSRIFDSRIGAVGFLVSSLYPAAVNFSIFALRDLYIYFFLLVNVCSFTWLVLRKDRLAFQGFIYLFSLLCVLFLRLALLPFMVMLPGWLLLLWWRKTFRRFRDVREKMFIVVILAIVVPVVGVASLYVTYTVVLRQIGIAEVVSPDVVLQQYTLNRYNRGYSSTSSSSGDVQVAGSGQGSDILPPSLYRSVPLPVRLGAQIVGMWMVPMPWLLTGFSRLLGFADSLFIFTLTLWALGTHRLIKTDGRGHQPHQYRSVRQYPPDVLRSLSFAMLMTYFVLMLCFGLLVTNSGNAFRMRLSTVPFVVIGASIYFSATYAWIGGRFVRTAAKKAARNRKLVPAEA